LKSRSKIAIGSDHGGYELKEELKAALEEEGCEVVDLGCAGLESVDYPDFGAEVASRVSRGEASRGLLVCTTGIGMSIVANKYPGVRAALVSDVTGARLSREHNDANVLVLGGGITGKVLGRDILRVWLSTPFAGGRHQRRVEKIELVESNVRENWRKRPGGQRE